jgi:hypothetical protein
MDDLYIPLQLVKLEETELVMLRQFFQERLGQRLLQYVRSMRPLVPSQLSAPERHMQLERRYGYEECFDNILSVLRPKSVPDNPQTQVKKD